MLAKEQTDRKKSIKKSRNPKLQYCCLQRKRCDDTEIEQYHYKKKSRKNLQRFQKKIRVVVNDFFFQRKSMNRRNRRL